MRRRRNHILHIIDSNGFEFHNDQDIISAFVSFYVSLWTDTLPGSPDGILDLDFPQVPTEAHSSIEASFQPILCSLQSLPNGKAPGQDSFSIDFFKLHWRQMGPLIVKCFMEFFHSASLPRNQGIPFQLSFQRVIGQNMLKTFDRSLSLILYRLLAKTSFIRIFYIMPQVIGKEQTTFIKSRSISDNVLLVQEITHSMSAFKKNQSVILIKIDLEKAFDKANQCSVLNALKAMNLTTTYGN